MAVTVTGTLGGTVNVTLSASGDSATPQAIINAGFGTLQAAFTIQIPSMQKVILNLAQGAIWDDSGWVYNLLDGASVRLNETYGTGIWRSGYRVQGSSLVKSKGATFNYNNFDNALGGRTIGLWTSAPPGFPASKPIIQWNDVAWVCVGGSNRAAVLSFHYSEYQCGDIMMDYFGDSAGANAGIGGSYGTIEKVTIYRAIGGQGTGFDANNAVSLGKFEYFSLPTGNTNGTNPDIKWSFPNNLPSTGFAPVFYRDPATTFIGANTTANEIVVDPIFPTGFNVLTNTRQFNPAGNTRTYRRTVKLEFNDGDANDLTGVTLYVNSGANVMVNAVQAGDFSQALNYAYMVWTTGSGYRDANTKVDTRAQTWQARKTGYVSQSRSYNLNDAGYSLPVFMLADPAMGNVTPAQAAALTGISIDYTNKVVTGSAARNLDQVYAWGSHSQALTANSAQADYQVSDGGIYRLLSPWKLNWTAGALTMGDYNRTVRSSTQWKFGNTASLTFDKDDVVWTPAVRGDTFQFESGSTFNITNGSTLTFSPTAALGYGTGTTSEFRSGSTLNMSDSTLIVNAPLAGSGTYFSNTEAGATWNISNSTWTMNAPAGGTQPQIAIHAYFLPASNINGLTINGTSTNVVWQMGFTTNNSKMVGFKYGGSIFGNGTSNILMDTYTYTGSAATIPNTFGSSNKWWWVDPTMQAGGLFRWAAGTQGATGNSGFYGVIGFRPVIKTEKVGYAPKMRIVASALTSRYPTKVIQTAEESTVSLSEFFRDPTFMASTDGFLPFLDSLDSKIVLNTIDWTLTFRQPGWLDQTRTFTASTAKTGLITYNAGGAVDSNYVNASTAVADLALITVNTGTKTIAPVSGTLAWSPQRLYNALKQWWATFASDTDFLAATANGVLNLGDYNTAAGLSFVAGASGDALTQVVTSGLINAPTNGISVTDSRGPSTIWQFKNIQVGSSLAVWDASGVTRYYQNQVTSAGDYTLYIPSGVTGTYYWAIEKYGSRREDGNFPANSGGDLFYVPLYVEDVGITQPTLATVLAYTEIETASKFYDRTAAFRLTEQGIKLGQMVTRAGTALEIGNFSHLINKDAASVYSVTGSVITTKSTAYAGDSRYTTEIAIPPATITANTNEVITINLEDANGNSSVNIQASGNNQFEIWKITNATDPDDYATGTLLDTVGIGVYRFISAPGFKMVIRDTTTNFRVVSPMEKGNYEAALFFGAAVQLAQAPEVTQINTKVDILQNSMEEVQAKTDGLTFTIPNVLDANIQYVNDIEVKGTGEENDPWNPV